MTRQLRRAAVLALALLAACKADPELRPDQVLQAELGLTDRDEVHRITITGGQTEVADPVETTLAPGAYVEFFTADWLVHEVAFELDSLSAEARSFLEQTDQVSSPPMVHRDSRFVIDFGGAPAGRYPFLLLGSGDDGRGVVIVVEKP